MGRWSKKVFITILEKVPNIHRGNEYLRGVEIEVSEIHRGVVVHVCGERLTHVQFASA